ARVDGCRGSNSDARWLHSPYGNLPDRCQAREPRQRSDRECTGRRARAREADARSGGAARVTSPDIGANRSAIWSRRLAKRARRVEQTPPAPIEGSLTRMIGLTLEATGCQASIGDYCDVI